MTRPAFYALAPGGWRDYVTLLHPPFTLWHLSYVVVGAALAPEWRPIRLGAGLVAFFLGLGVASHALDELRGRPLATRIPERTLWTIAAVSLAGAVGVGVAAAAAWTWWLLAFVAVGGFLAVAYNLELFGGRFHGDLWFAIAWGALPLLAAFFAAAEAIRWEALVAAGFAALSSLAQRRLSTVVRFARRRVGVLDGGARASEEALVALNAAIVLLAVALAVLRAR